MRGIISSHWVNLKLALRFHALLIVTILSLKKSILFLKKKHATKWLSSNTNINFSKCSLKVCSLCIFKTVSFCVFFDNFRRTHEMPTRAVHTAWLPTRGCTEQGRVMMHLHVSIACPHPPFLHCLMTWWNLCNFNRVVTILTAILFYDPI